VIVIGANAALRAVLAPGMVTDAMLGKPTAKP
jgi:hypothetical protein